MFCPQCRNEKRPEFTVCPECNVPLLEELPYELEPEYVDFATIFESGNPALIAMAKSLLESADIQYFVEGEQLQDLFGGRMVHGFNPVIGATEIQVAEDDVEEALTLLEDMGDGNFENYYDEEDE